MYFGAFGPYQHVLRLINISGKAIKRNQWQSFSKLKWRELIAALEGSFQLSGLLTRNWHTLVLDYSTTASIHFTWQWHNCFETRQIFCVYFLAAFMFLAGSHVEMCLVLIDSYGQHCRSQVGTTNPDKDRQKQTTFSVQLSRVSCPFS